MVIKRMLAELVDVMVNIFLLVFEVKFILPMFTGLLEHEILYFIFTLAIYISLIVLAQGLFWNNGESIGKYFMRLEIYNKDEEEDVTLELMFMREFLVKYITFYFSCLPLFFGKESIQEKVTNTVVRRKHVAAKV